MPSALASPASLKGVLSARDAAAALAEGLRSWADADEVPVADGGEGTLDVLHAAVGGRRHEVEVADAFGRPRLAQWLELPSGAAVVEAAEAIPFDPERLDPLAATSRGLGELIHAVGSPPELLVCLGGTANVDGGAGCSTSSTCCRRRRASPATSTSRSSTLRESSLRRKAHRTRMRPSWRRHSTRCNGWRLTPSWPGQERRAVSAQRSHRSAPSSCRERRSSST